MHPGSRSSQPSARGSALVLAVFALALLTGMGAALLFLGQHETRMGRASLRTNQVFYFAEAAIEDARATLFELNGESPFTDDLHAAAGANDIVDFDVSALQATYDGAGRVTGFSGYGDDVPVRSLVALADSNSGATGWYAVFLTNDPLEGRLNKTDGNARVMVTGIGAGTDRTLEIVEAIIEPARFLPPAPPAAITLLGPNPQFDNGDSSAQEHHGEDCGITGGAYAPLVGAIGNAATGEVQADLQRPETFSSGGFSGTGTVGDLTDPGDPIVDAAGNGTIDPQWVDCEDLRDNILRLMQYADFYCNGDVTTCTLPATNSLDDIVIIDGDLANTPAGAYTGILIVTGTLVYNGNTGWNGLILVVGEGSIVRSGGGSSNPSGGLVVANIDPTPDGPRADKSDWCSTGFGSASYETQGAGNSTVQWCNADLLNANSVRSYPVVEFIQR